LNINMPGHHAVLINDQQEAQRILASIGSTPMGIDIMIPKAVFRCIKLVNVDHRAARLLKQEMLAKGGEAAVAKEVVNTDGQSDVLLMGTLRQYRLLIDKMKLQPFGLKALASEMENILAALTTDRWEVPLANGGNLSVGSKTLLMGILNITPDSFSDGGRFFDAQRAIEHAYEMAAEGADIIDIGGASSRPDSTMADEEEELRRILPVVKQLAADKLIISIDTFRARVAEAALEAGAHIINDIGSFEMDPGLLPVLVKYQAPVVIMHNRMQIRPEERYKNLIDDVIADLQASMFQAVESGLAPDRVIIDPGLGFGKTPVQNMLLIKRLQDLRSLGRPILIGSSRKNFIGRTLDLEVGERLEGSLAIAALAAYNGANLIRAHDVKATHRTIKMMDAVRASDNG
jgi:dihydropteroate synthase